MIGNLLNQGTIGWYLFTVSFAALLLAFTAVTAINFALIYGSGRFDEAAKLGLAQKRPLLTLIPRMPRGTGLDGLCLPQNHTEGAGQLPSGHVFAFSLSVLAFLS